MNIFELDAGVLNRIQRKFRIVVRISTSWFRTKRGISSRKDISYMKRLSYGFNPFDEYDSEELSYAMIDVEKHSDGLYKIILRGDEDDFEMTFIPFKKEK